MKNEKGFSLVELLVVVIIIAIIAAIAIPSLLASRRAANEASAISSLRTVHSGQATYFATTGANANYALDLTALAPLIDPNLATGTKSGYAFVMNGVGGLYCATGNPSTAGTTGDRYFSVLQTGVIYQSTATAGCTAAGVWSAGTASAAIQ